MNKPFSEITLDDLVECPVWEFIPETEEHDETWIQPVSHLPVVDLSGRLVCTTLRLASGQSIWAVLGNISLYDARSTQHFRTVTVFRADGETFDLARYHDVDADQRGPSALAEFLGIPESNVFPMSYDISSVANGLPEVILGKIDREPEERLSEDELIDLALG